uniref:Sigma 54 modulation/S30EA ribosomal protein C-terminal domain-containing protein n=1 Tax=Hemiselmis andersenii TaxID=464988 RepID=A0A6T8LT77_HEMAN|mmetsp:Transcript_11902/g.27700  ORF Transcript_11902/g.27700 Transcript_11902/m.27700 type:complete len:250 (-) Transcript_11902:350-1099(-)|eukprot:CAMPEP_0114145998 /NCGR_PEP_ID=MMETSP0043_2-20121206/20337_1 /TAXON_ID=464988 /ORGANISM="Hemiselmis andersenii, Strain CCMP644" /LENGTH=249 /DNA_ID=CAMNT_0001240437 /DNA_START=91 /DNA_END=840 /DNA_ORIENTATION=+
MKCTVATIALAALVSHASAFNVSPIFGAPCALRRSSAAVAPLRMAANVPILISGNNIEVTPAIKDYVNKKFGKALDKVGKQVTKCDVHLIYDQNPAISTPNHVEVTLFAKGATIRAHKNNDDMYATIDEVSDTIKRKLRKYKERIIDTHRQGKAEAQGVTEEEISMFEEFNTEVMEEMKKSDIVDVPAPDMSSIQTKTFSMEPISLEEAVLCLEYIDHDFYVFKNKDKGNKVQCVYNRNAGGVGLIEPE